MSLLLKDPDRHARAMLEHSYGSDNIIKLKTIGWSEVGAKVYAQIWEKQVAEKAKWLSTLSPDQLPSNKKWFEDCGNRLTNDIEDAPEYRIGFAVHVLTCAIGVILLRQGWTIETGPGKPIVLVKDDVRFDPRASIAKLADGSLPIDEWKTTCRSMAIEGVPLAAAPGH